MTARPPRPTGFASRLAPSIDAYLRLKEALGRQCGAERTIFRALDGFLTTVDGDLTSETFAAWNATLGRLTSGVRRNWLRVVRNLCLYRRRTMPDAFVPDPTGFPKPHVAIRPYIFTTGGHLPSAAGRGSAPRHRALTLAPRDVSARDRAAVHEWPASRRARSLDRRRLRPA